VKDHPAKAVARRLRATIPVLAVLMAPAIPIRSQSPQSQPPNITNNERVRQQEMSKREWQLRNLANDPGKAPEAPGHAQAIAKQVEEDFTRILTLHNDFARTLSVGNNLDYNFISDAAGEIRKRSSRLQSTLALPKLEVNEKNEDKLGDISPINDSQFRAVLTVLCREIESFVNNPIIATPGTVDAQQLVKARHDLERVVEVSDNIRKSADRLKKTIH
jgi:hypothetical protein